MTCKRKTRPGRQDRHPRRRMGVTVASIEAYLAARAARPQVSLARPTTVRRDYQEER